MNLQCHWDFMNNVRTDLNLTNFNFGQLLTLTCLKNWDIYRADTTSKSLDTNLNLL